MSWRGVWVNGRSIKCLAMHHNGALRDQACPVFLVAIFEVDRGAQHINPNRVRLGQAFALIVYDYHHQVVGASEYIGERPAVAGLGVA